MKTRRNFIKLTALGSAAIFTSSCLTSEKKNVTVSKLQKDIKKPIVISTWNHGLEANEASWKILSKGGTALDAVEAGVKITESDPNNTSVGLGGLPDRDGKVTLDACIMDHENNCGAVACLQDIENPISVARKVMEETQHVMLVGEGAKQFALEKGFKETNLLTEKSKEAWEKWKEESKYQPVINSENHDTIGMLAIDKKGDISGACTTSGLAWKMHGRVGDSPIIGAGMYVDNEVGGCCATGLGEAVMKTLGSFLIVELMRQGKSPFEACKEIVERIYNKHKNHKDMEYLQVGFIAVNKNGEHGGYSLRSGFNFAVYDSENGNRMEDSQFKMSWDN